MIHMILRLVAHIVLRASRLLVGVRRCLVWLLIDVMVIIMGVNWIVTNWAAIIIVRRLIVWPVWLVMHLVLGVVTVVMVLPSILSSPTQIGAACCRSGNIILSHWLRMVVLVFDGLILTWVDGVDPCVGATSDLVVITLILQFVLLIARSLFQRFPLLIVDLTVTITRHYWTLLANIGELVRRAWSTINALSQLIGSGMDFLLILTLLLVLITVGDCLPISNHVLNVDISLVNGRTHTRLGLSMVLTVQHIRV